MNIAIKLHGWNPASNDAIHAFESATGYTLPDSFKEFLRAYNGAIAAPNLFKTDDGFEIGVHQFVLIENIPNERKLIEELPPKSFPIAWDEGGNYILINGSKNDAIQFWDHETGDIHNLASDFESFVSRLTPFDVESVKLIPGQVKRVWVNPDILKKIKKQKDR